LSYNIQDAVNLEYIMVWAYNRKLSGIPLTLNMLEPCKIPDNPFSIDAATVNRIKQYNSGFHRGWSR